MTTSAPTLTVFYIDRFEDDPQSFNSDWVVASEEPAYLSLGAARRRVNELNALKDGWVYDWSALTVSPAAV